MRDLITDIEAVIMETKHMQTPYDHNDTEATILSKIVDAMLDAEARLKSASVEEWRRILVDSCRQKKQAITPA